MKITILILAALLPLSACIFVPEHRAQGDGRGHDRGSERCGREGNCDHDRN